MKPPGAPWPLSARRRRSAWRRRYRSRTPTPCSTAASKWAWRKWRTRENVGLLAYSPLAFGMLTGKYRDGQWPANARLTLFKHFARYTNDQASHRRHRGLLPSGRSARRQPHAPGAAVRDHAPVRDQQHHRRHQPQPAARKPGQRRYGLGQGPGKGAGSDPHTRFPYPAP